MTKFEKDQVWKSKSCPHEDFKIYDVIVQEWDNHPTEVFYCWERLNHEAFVKMVADRKKMSLDDFLESHKTTHPFAWAGESQRNVLMNKIRKCEMKLIENENIN